MDWKKSTSGVIGMSSFALYKRQKQLEDENAELKKQLLAVLKKNSELEARLLAYENAHTPPSKQHFKKQPPTEPNGKLGAKKGHEKWERKQQEPTQTIEDKQKTCPHCDHKLDEPTKIVQRIIEEIPEPQPIIVTKYLLHHYHCKHCGKTIKPKTQLPRGSFGYNIQTKIALLNVDSRLPLRKIKSILKTQYNMEITDAHIYKMLHTMSNKLSPKYKKNISLIRASPFVHADETQIKLNGQKHWLWVFTNLQTTVFTITRSRSKKTIKEILGENYSGIIICDGWSAYPNYTKKIQRCWAHILREAKYLTQDYPLFKNFYERLCEMFNKIKQLTQNKKLTNTERQIEHDKLFKQLQEQLDCMGSHKNYKKLANKIRNGGTYWFTCVLYPFIQPTNNPAEQTLREPIVRRKIFGCLRNQKGANTFSILTSLITTYKQQGLNPAQQIKQLLTNS